MVCLVTWSELTIIEHFRYRLWLVDLYLAYEHFKVKISQIKKNNETTNVCIIGCIVQGVFQNYDVIVIFQFSSSKILLQSDSNSHLLKYVYWSLLKNWQLVFNDWHLVN